MADIEELVDLVFRSVLGLFVGLSCPVLFGLSLCVSVGPVGPSPRVVNCGT